MTKEELRRQMRKIRVEGRGDVLQRLFSVIRGSSEEIHAQHVGCYYPLVGEPYVLGLDLRYDLAFPRGDHWLACNPEDLVIGEWGIPTAPGSAKIVEPDFVVVPGLAFDRFGGRLGQGRGYYDRLLKDFKGVKIGVCWSSQIVSAVPMEDHDVKMDVVVTESEIIRPNDRSGTD